MILYPRYLLLLLFLHGIELYAQDPVDSTDTFQKAVIASRDVLVPAGTFRIRALNLPPNTRLRGTGSASILVVEKDGTGIVANEGTTITDLNIRAEETNDGKTAPQQERALITLAWDGKRFVRNVTLSGLHLSNYRYSGIHADHAEDLTIRDCRLEKLNYGIHIVFSKRVKIDGCRVSDAAAHGIQFWGNWQNQNRHSEEIIITNNIVRNGGGGAIWGTGAERVVVANNSVDGATDVGIDLEWCADATISGNVVRNCENACISLFFACQRVSITGNTIFNNRPITNPEAAWWVSSGIWLTSPNKSQFPDDNGHRDVTIIGNTITCVEGRRRAIWIGAAAENITIQANTISGAKIWRGDPPVVD